MITYTFKFCIYANQIVYMKIFKTHRLERAIPLNFFFIFNHFSSTDGCSVSANISDAEKELSKSISKGGPLGMICIHYLSYRLNRVNDLDLLTTIFEKRKWIKNQLEVYGGRRFNLGTILLLLSLTCCFQLSQSSTKLVIIVLLTGVRFKIQFLLQYILSQNDVCLTEKYT